MSEPANKREELAAREQAARVELAKHEAGRNELTRIERDLTSKIATLLPHESLKIRGELRDVLEAITDATGRLEQAQKRVAEAERELREHDARLVRERLTVEYARVRGELIAELKVAEPLYVKLDAIAREISKVVMSELGNRRALNLAPAGIGVVDGEIRLLEGQPWADG